MQHRHHGHNHDNGSDDHSDPSGCCQGSAVAGAKAIDPVCGMEVDPSDSKHQVEHNGQTIYFCCARCREKFVAEPDRYAASGEASVETAAAN